MTNTDNYGLWLSAIKYIAAAIARHLFQHMFFLGLPGVAKQQDIG